MPLIRTEHLHLKITEFCISDLELFKKVHFIVLFSIKCKQREANTYSLSELCYLEEKSSWNSELSAWNSAN